MVNKVSNPKEYPILFKGPMVRALLEGRKAQTRRLSKRWLKVKAGDRLWVKETFRLRRDQDDKPPSQDWWKSGAWYPATDDGEPSGCGGGMGKKRPSIHMPRWASRITLEATEDARLERLQEISGADLVDEGIEWPDNLDFLEVYGQFQDLWQSLRTKPGERREDNPEVVVLTFRVLPDSNGDQVPAAMNMVRGDVTEAKGSVAE